MSVDYRDGTFLFQFCTTSFDLAMSVADRDLIELRTRESRFVHILFKKLSLRVSRIERTPIRRYSERLAACAKQI